MHALNPIKNVLFGALPVEVAKLRVYPAQLTAIRRRKPYIQSAECDCVLERY